MFIAVKFGLLAQLVEHWTLNPLVAGSNPSQPTTHDLLLVFFEPEHAGAATHVENGLLGHLAAPEFFR